MILESITGVGIGTILLCKKLSEKTHNLRERGSVAVRQRGGAALGMCVVERNEVYISILNYYIL